MATARAHLARPAGQHAPSQHAPSQHAPAQQAPAQHGLYFLVAFGIVLLVRPGNPMHVLQATLADPDSYMRLLRVQAALDQGRWFGDVVPRDASGSGLVLPWSHLLDGLILLLRAPLRLILPPDQALLWAGAITGPLAVGLLGLLCAWAVAPLAAREGLWTAPLAVALSPTITDYGQLGCVTHHILLVALAVGVCGAAGRAAFGDIRAGCLAGLLTGLGIWLSPESTPYDMMAFGAMLLSWAIRPAPRVAASLAVSGTVFLATIAVALLLDPPHAGRTVPELDRLSVVFLSLAMIMCALCGVPYGLRAIRRPASRVAILALTGAVGGALWLALFPGLSRGLAGLMTPDEAMAFFEHIQEMAPLDTPSRFALYALSGSLAVFATVGLAARQTHTLPRLLWGYAGLCGAVSLVLAVQHGRFSPYPQAAAAMMLPVLVSHASRTAPARWRPQLRPGLLAAFLGAPILLGILLATRAETGQAAADRAAEARCPVRAEAGLLAPFPGAVVLANVNDGPELLYRSDVTIVGSLYHTGIAGFMRLRAAWRARDLDTVPPELRATGALYILACPGAPRTPIVDGPPTTLFDRLNRGDPPPWLHPVSHASESGWVLYTD